MANNNDIPWLLEQLQQFDSFVGTKYSMFKSKDFAEKKMIEILKKHLVMIAENDIKPVGFIAGLVHEHLFNPELKVLTEIFWWVDRAHRGTRAGLMLLNSFVEWGESYCDWISVNLEEKSPVSDRCLTKRGFKVLETSYLKEIY